MSSRQQPDRVRILSSGNTASVEGRRRSDLPLDLDDFEDDELGAAPVAPRPVAIASNEGPLPLRLVGLFLCCSALGGACAVASGLFGIPVQ
jgi:hypothetical protein